MHKYDTAFQRIILESAGDAYPEPLDPRHAFGDEDFGRVVVNVRYLEQRGLLEVNWIGSLNTARTPFAITLTADGIDFLRRDGGLGAVLNVVVVRFEADTIRDILIRQVENAKEDEGVKRKLVEQLKSAPAEVLKELTKKGLDAALPYVPALVTAISGWMR